MKRLYKFLGVLIIVLLARSFPFNLIIGSYCSVFSWTTVFAPVVAVQCGLGWVGLFLYPKKLITGLTFSLFFLHRLPLFFASWAFQKRSVVTSIYIPLLCISAFIMHSTGFYAWQYSLYWLIPIGLYFVRNSQISRALSASFVAHAVGSVIWLYMGTISATTWLALIPIVACERLLIAGSIYMCNHLCNLVVYLYKEYKLSFFSDYKVFK